MPALNLPKPVNSYAGEDELRKQNGAAAAGAEEDIGEYRPPRHSDKFKVGLIYPPPEMRSELRMRAFRLTPAGIIDKTALAVSQTGNPDALEGKIRESQASDPRFSFLADEDPYHQYYKWKKAVCVEDAEDVAKGLKPAVSTPGGSATPAPRDQTEDLEPIPEPKSWEFKVDLPGVTAQDLDILRLTALFHARRGRSFLTALSVREGRNYQFDFLRPTHSLYGYYNRMVESYQKVMHPPEGQVAGLIAQDANPRAKWDTLEEAKGRAAWEQRKRRREDDKAKERDEEAKEFAEIDWQDFVTVETIEFTQADMDLDLPPPSSIDKLRQMSMAEKRMAAMIMEEPAAQAPAAAAGEEDIEEVDMEEDDDDEAEEARNARLVAEREQARARDVQRATLQSRGVKIRKDYVPKGIQRGGPVATAQCPYCGQSIPENELSEHIRIELLDPRWKDQKRELEQRRQQQAQLQVGADVSKSLKNLAAARTDMFGDEEDEAARKKREEEALKRKRDREKVVWDGHTNSAAKVSDTFQSRYGAEDAARRERERRGISDTPINTVGPQVGPGIAKQKAGQSKDSGKSAPTRAAPDDDDAPQPRLKKSRVDKLPNGQLYSEIDWMSLHPEPIALQVQLPSMADKPEWKLDGRTIIVPDLPVNLTFGNLRDRIKRAVDADLPVSRLRLDYNGKVMNNASSLASVNLDEGDVVVLSVRKK
ncbi:pre-mRNA splicing factor [Trichosporon asahii var. asahii CBS 2479]|uniref:Pre-mRNA splicing factor n=1 Tax=Trichosporon asahii var. asahii (strain ATCC 90039 / CBS 2479 / JCM 2466 / KCTC 7840 / NBRC 103889/ NCYC 2677 / UAMH 7654) TaxID=1186058 RepID=J6EMW6_TRIAS|nr:pre-mRNA splicing factor [Trichosporon asahii var. asahii CBS 2479]EJT45664.1 pre-mRNA splicing factor [Trichosporon asahii var. asahii CBS 2479]